VKGTPRLCIYEIKDVDEDQGLVVFKPIIHVADRQNEWYLLDLNSEKYRSLGRLRDYGFFLKYDVLSAAGGRN
jgi:hypothetical protein